MPANVRTFASSNFFLNLDGKPCGFLKSVEGGTASAEVVQEKVGPDRFSKKHLAGIKYEPLVLEIDLSMAKSIYDWISDSWARKYARHDGSILIGDANFKVQSEMDFFDALISETTIPAMDASSKDAARMTVKIAPEYTRFKKGSGKISGKFPKSVQKRWLPSNFRLEIDGLDCTKVSKIEAFTVKQNISTDPVGEERDYNKEPTSIEFPNLTITLPESKAQTWLDWHEDFVIKGNNGDDKEKNGTLIFLATDLKKELARVNFSHLGIFRLTPDKYEAGSENIRRVKAELYCEEMRFDYKGISA